MSIIMDILNKIYFQGRDFISGIVENISLESLNLDKKYGDIYMEKFNIKVVLKIIKDMAKELVGIQLGKFIKEVGLMVKDMDKAL